MREALEEPAQVAEYPGGVAEGRTSAPSSKDQPAGAVMPGHTAFGGYRVQAPADFSPALKEWKATGAPEEYSAVLGPSSSSVVRVWQPR